MRFSALAGVLAAGLPLVYADVEFTAPAAGDNVPAGTINVQWQESGKAPSITDLTQYTLALYVGGNDDTEMQQVVNFVSGGTFATGNSAQATIPGGIAAAIPNGFFFKMTSTTSNGGTVINYSDRFNISGLTGTAGSQFSSVVAKLDGNTAGPQRVVNVEGITASSSIPASSSTPATATTSTQQTVTITAGGSHPTSTANNNPGLNGGAMIGVIVGAVLIALAILSVACWTLYRRKRRRDQENPDPLSDQGAEMSGHNAKSNMQESVTALSELSSDGRVVELGDEGPPVEMDIRKSFRAELPGDFTHAEAIGSPVTPLERPGTPHSDMGSPVTPVSRL